MSDTATEDLDRNARRRARYAEDRAYRERRLQERRESYRRTNDGAVEGRAALDVDKALELMKSSGGDGTVRSCEPVDGVQTRFEAHVFTPEEAAALFNRNPQIISRWRSRELFPDPFLEDEAGFLYYGAAEVEGFIRVLAEHQKKSLHLRRENTATVEGLRQASFKHNHDLFLRTYFPARSPRS